MYIASLVLSLLSLLFSWIPFFNFILALIALIISIVAVARKREDKNGRGMAISGVIISSISIIISIAFCIVIVLVALKVPSFLETVTNEIKEEIDITDISSYVEAETMLASKYVQVTIKNKNNEYTGYINSVTEEYTDKLSGIEVDDFYENYLKQNRYDYDVNINNLGEPEIDKD